MAVLAVRRGPEAHAVDDHDRSERAPRGPRRPAESLEEGSRSLDRPPRPRVRRQAPRGRYRSGHVRLLAVVEHEVDGGVALELVLDDLRAHPPDPPLEVG